MRNMGSSVGTSLVTTLIARRSQFHQARLVQQARPDNPNFQNSLNGLSQRLTHAGLSAHEARLQAYARIYQEACRRKRRVWHISIFSVVLRGGSGDHVLSEFVLKRNNPRWRRERGGGIGELERPNWLTCGASSAREWT